MAGAGKALKQMTFTEIYHRIIPLWGREITFADGLLMETKRNYKTLTGAAGAKSHFYSKTLSDQWQGVADAIAPDDAYGDLMVWTLYQVFQEYAQRMFEQNQYAFSPAAVPKKEIEERYYKNLQDQGWEAQLAGYERITE
jgi:hypothetical protein